MNNDKRARIVWSAPLLTFTDLFTRSRPELQPAFGAANAFLCHQGWTALWHGIRSLGLTNNASVAFPAFHCGLELDVLQNLGLTPRFYDINPKLGVDMPTLEKATDERTEAVFITHYFGIVQDMDPVMEFCREHNLRLIEDCAHTWKSVPVPGTA